MTQRIEFEILHPTFRQFHTDSVTNMEASKPGHGRAVGAVGAAAQELGHQEAKDSSNSMKRRVVGGFTSREC